MQTTDITQQQENLVSINYLPFVKHFASHVFLFNSNCCSKEMLFLPHCPPLAFQTYVEDLLL